jgi:hypothetical protein
VVRREPDRTRIRRDIRDPDRLRITDQHTQQTVAGRGVTESCPLFLGDTDRDEVLDPASVRCEDAEGSVARVREVGREVDDTSEDRIERELGREHHPRLDQSTLARVPHER